MYALQLFIVKLADAYTTILLVYVLMSWIRTEAAFWPISKRCWGRFAIRI